MLPSPAMHSLFQNATSGSILLIKGQQPVLLEEMPLGDVLILDHACKSNYIRIVGQEMGRTRPKKKQHTKASDPPVQHVSSATAAKAPSIPALLEKVQELIVQCDYELALRFVRRILEQQPGSIEAREMLGVCLLETGEIDAAKEAFQFLVQPPSPQPPPASAHLYLAQIFDDDPTLALQHYQAAVDILINQLKGKQSTQNPTSNSTPDENEIKSNIVRALIGQVEIWMDPSYDLCFEPEAEKTCEDLLNLALQTDANNPEALQALASVRMSQQRPEDAKQILEQVWTLWKDLDLDDPRLPPIPTRLSLVKLFLELSLYTPALLVLQGVMVTDDQEVEAWYLEGWCFFLMSESAKESGDGKLDDMGWEELAKDSRDCLETCKVLHINQDHPDKPILEHVQELVAKLEVLGIKPSPLEDDQDDEGEVEWEDVSEGEDGDVEMD
ncbi:TPR-like protein [Macrolepiota fuliginosa MF-IS2]|uniref:TPR-like protein n=1 Tax=Macrolepiota fuliginosa MF-IS2 TaxID=1400762 RepID=A0A9P5XKL1_9AGAR|nr:TPR-like protein [Macrolepiota fuliginosa MF-IS2]